MYKVSARRTQSTYQRQVTFTDNDNNNTNIYVNKFDLHQDESIHHTLKMCAILLNHLKYYTATLKMWSRTEWNDHLIELNCTHSIRH